MVTDVCLKWGLMQRVMSQQNKSSFSVFKKNTQCLMHSVIWHCWLGGRKGIWPVKNWAVGYWHGYLSWVRCRHACPVDATATHCLLHSRLVLPFCYRLTRVVLDKGLLNGCVCVCLIHFIICSHRTTTAAITALVLHLTIILRVNVC